MAATIAVVAPSSRETVMEYLWNRIFDFFEAEEYEKAEITFFHYTRLEEMSDVEYLSTCHCGIEDCSCEV